MIEKNEQKRPSANDVLSFIRKIYNSKKQNNSTIDCIYRCLFSFQNFTNYMKRNKDFIKQTAKIRPISRSFNYAISKMDNNDWPNELNNIREILTYENPCFPDPGIINPIDLIHFMLIRFHKESITNGNITPENPYFYTPDNSPSMLNYQQSLNDYLAFFQNYKSCVSDFFFGTYQLTKFSNKCKNKKFIFKNFLYIIFNIDEAFKNGLSGNNNNSLINYFIKQNSLLVNKPSFCAFCNNITLHQENQQFFTLPYNLIICFKGDKDTYDNKYITYLNELDLSSLGIKSGITNYYLKGVIKSYLNNNIKYYICIYEDNAKKQWIISDGYSKNFIISPLNHSVGDVVMLFYSSFN